MKQQTTIQLIFTILLILNNIKELNAQPFSSEIYSITQQIQADSIEQTINTLQGFETRFLLNKNRLEIALFLENKLKSYGFENTRIDTFESHIVHAKGIDTIVYQYNVIATLPGNANQKQIIVYGAHYDSFSTDTDPLVKAPGADDNASGTAAVLETARAIKASNIQIPQTIEFVLFAAEEYLLSCKSGSEYYTEKAKANEENIVFMINNDMVSYNDGNNTICFSNYPSCIFATNQVVSACNKYSDLNYQLWPSTWPAFADVEPFFNMGVPCVYMEESYFNPFYHTSNDIVDHIDFAYCAEVARISCGTILSYPLATSVNEDRYSSIAISPNLISNKLSIQLPEGEMATSIEIYTTSGKLVFQQKKSGSLTIYIPNISNGFYILNVKTTGRNYSERFVKMN